MSAAVTVPKSAGVIVVVVPVVGSVTTRSGSVSTWPAANFTARRAWRTSNPYDFIFGWRCFSN